MVRTYSVKVTWLWFIQGKLEECVRYFECEIATARFIDRMMNNERVRELEVHRAV